MSAASNQTVRVRKPSVTRQATAFEQELHWLWLTRSWEDKVTVVSLVLFVATLLFLVVVG
jgi:hypothetical protein